MQEKKAEEFEDEEGVLDPGCIKAFTASDMEEACRRLEAEIERMNKQAAGQSSETQRT